LQNALLVEKQSRLTYTSLSRAISCHTHFLHEKADLMRKAGKAGEEKSRGQIAGVPRLRPRHRLFAPQRMGPVGEKQLSHPRAAQTDQCAAEPGNEK
jgi:hypothetical protein